ncbi:hypothetical protein T4E_6997 [Trichinella pseudospiralis]|uniref:Uncharacterized protein n=1 Tax=Trichinella pseudospiralis TaxID=6337 RepID=A0A0V0YFP6_TRIPS|nr:hypothetical protein T4E_6997 [Trichinella pseudospiralis]
MFSDLLMVPNFGHQWALASVDFILWLAWLGKLSEHGSNVYETQVAKDFHGLLFSVVSLRKVVVHHSVQFHRPFKLSSA